MVNVEERLNILYQKVQKLSKQYAAVQSENISLKKELEKQTSLSATTIEQAEKLQRQLDGLNFSSHIWSLEDKKLLQKRIDTYLKEIDTCLQLIK